MLAMHTPLLGFRSFGKVNNEVVVTRAHRNTVDPVKYQSQARSSLNLEWDLDVEIYNEFI